MPLVKKLPPRQLAVVVVAVVVVLALILWLNSDSDAEDLVESSSNRWFICTETGKSFRLKVTPDTEFPVVSPHSGKPTGKLAELCFWTKDGQPKADPTPVLLNERVGKSGPTFCPDCGRLVVGTNPLPGVGKAAPPTQAEYEARRPSRSARLDANAR